MPEHPFPILPTTVVGSYAIPSWLWAAYEKIEAGGFGEMDLGETEDDAVEMAVRDQERAGLDAHLGRRDAPPGVHRLDLQLLHRAPAARPRRKVGILSYDGHIFYEPTERITAPNGLGMRKELAYLKQATTRPFKITSPGPWTLATQIRPGGPYRDRRDIAADLAPIINAESSARWLPRGRGSSRSTRSTRASSWIRRTWWTSITAASRGQGREALLPHLLRDARGVQLQRAFLSPALPGDSRRPDGPIPLRVRQPGDERDRALARVRLPPRSWAPACIDLKNFYVEKPEVVARRIRRLLEHVPVDRLWINPDCGLARLPRYLAFAKLKAMVAGTRIVQRGAGQAHEPLQARGRDPEVLEPLHADDAPGGAGPAPLRRSSRP